MTRRTAGLLPMTKRMFDSIPAASSPEYAHERWHVVAQIREDYINWKITPLIANESIKTHITSTAMHLIADRCNRGDPSGILAVHMTTRRLKLL